MNLSPAQIAQYAANAGFAGDDLVTAVAIALAESNGGNPNAYNSEPQDVPGNYGRASAGDGLGSYGLWQIYLAAHPEFAGANLLDPQTNANAAYSIYAIAGGFRPWSTFTSGVYGMYETPAMLAQVQPSAPPAAVPAPLVVAAAAPIGQPIVSATPTAASLVASVAQAAESPSMTDTLILGGLGLLAAWLISEA
jgi:Lysozyme like domain